MTNSNQASNFMAYIFKSLQAFTCTCPIFLLNFKNSYISVCKLFFKCTNWKSFPKAYDLSFHSLSMCFWSKCFYCEYSPVYDFVVTLVVFWVFKLKDVLSTGSSYLGEMFLPTWFLSMSADTVDCHNSTSNEIL